MAKCQRYPQNQSVYADERKDGQQAEISKRREGNKEGNMRYDVLPGYGENTRVMVKHPDMQLHLNTVGLHYTKSRKLSIRREERIGMFRKKISFRSGKEMREKTTAEKLKKKVQ